MAETLFIRAYLPERKAPSWVNTDKIIGYNRLLGGTKLNLVLPVIALTQKELHDFHKERCKYFVRMPWW